MVNLERVEILRLALERHDDDEKALDLARRMLRILSGSTAIRHTGIPAPLPAADALTEDEAEYLEDMERLETDTPRATRNGAAEPSKEDATSGTPPPPMEARESASNLAAPILSTERAAGRDWEWSYKHAAEMRRRAGLGESDPVIAEAMGLPIMLVERKRRELGIRKREMPRGDRSARKAERQARVREMVAANATNEEMKAALGCSHQTIHRYLQELDLVGKRPKGRRVGKASASPDSEPKAARRFTEMPDLHPEDVQGLAEDHPAVVEGRTLFPTTVVGALDSPRLLISGQNSRKLGSHVTKGRWKNFPIYSLTLEERATCPRECHHWNDCMGNGMPMARRHEPGPDLEIGLQKDLRDKQRAHPEGFVVRLHVLGDFYSTDYVEIWGEWLKEFPALHVFGYTRWPRSSDIGAAVKALTDAHWDRFAIRFSDPEPKPQGATTINYVPESPTVPEGIVCPAETGRVGCCGDCTLCWAPAAREKTIAFIRHGPKFAGRPRAIKVDQTAVTVLSPVKPRAPRAVKARGTYGPKPRPYLPAIVPTYDATDVIAEAAEADIKKPLPEALSRRCPRCNQVFACHKLSEVICPTCTGTHAVSSNGAQKIGRSTS